MTDKIEKFIHKGIVLWEVTQESAYSKDLRESANQKAEDIKICINEIMGQIGVKCNWRVGLYPNYTMMNQTYYTIESVFHYYKVNHEN